jgi:hypothetical protein
MPEITDLSKIPMTEIEITEEEVNAAISSLVRADKDPRYAKWLKGQVEALAAGKGRVEVVVGGGLAAGSVLVMVCNLIAHAKEHPGGRFHRICLKRGLLDSLGNSYTPSYKN